METDDFTGCDLMYRLEWIGSVRRALLAGGVNDLRRQCAPHPA